MEKIVLVFIMNHTHESATRYYYPAPQVQGANGQQPPQLYAEHHVRQKTTWDHVPACILAVGLAAAVSHRRPSRRNRNADGHFRVSHGSVADAQMNLSPICH